ncbi:30S ribosomal protein S6 [Saccharopolyspora kobensis]|uniref:30S ribosomal protein S6 n=1 Tax=Saccharopolyspora kobensis TaxID=146035 RepID=UPI003320EAF4
MAPPVGSASPRVWIVATSEATDGGTVEKVDVWGRRRLSYEIEKNAEGIYVVLDLNSEPATIKELDRQLNLNESILRTKVLRKVVEPRKAARAAKARAAAAQASA